jgi:hypothetical protein
MDDGRGEPRVDITLVPPDVTDFALKACKACKVCIVTRNEKTSNGALQFKTSVWVLSENRGTRLQQECKFASYKNSASCRL